MSNNVFTLDALREETIKRYAPVVIGLSDGTTIELKPVLRLPKTERDAVVAAVESISKIDDDFDEDDQELLDEYSEKVCDAIAEVFKLVTTKPKKLLAELDHEDPQIKVTLYTAVLNRWLKESQVGEAASSPA